MTDRRPNAVYALDASALLCLLFGEPGSDQVEKRLSGALVSAVNYHEVLAMLADQGVDFAEAQTMLAALDIDVVPVDRNQADVGGKLHSETRSIGLSLGARSCLALALCREAIAVTADRAWETLDFGVVVERVR